MKDYAKLNRLSDDALEAVSGGSGIEENETVFSHCPECNADDENGTTEFRLYSGGQGKCLVCGHTKML